MTTDTTDTAGEFTISDEGMVYYPDGEYLTDEGDDLVTYMNQQLKKTARLETEVDTLRTRIAELEGERETCGDCREPIRDACRCSEHLRICEEQQRAEQAEARVETVQGERDEAERLLRLAGVRVLGEDSGDQSLEFLRRYHSPELADISIAIELAARRLRARTPAPDSGGEGE